MRLKGLLLFASVLMILPAATLGHVLTPRAVIVDTDAALDDIRALELLCQSPDVEIVAVVTSDGACAPREGARNVQMVLDALARGNIPVSPGRSLGLPPPPWREMSESLAWSGVAPSVEESEIGDAQGAPTHGSAVESIWTVLQNSRKELIYICLGPMTNLAEALRADSSLTGRISAVYYSGSVPGVVPPSWNTERDVSAARTVFEYPVRVFSFRMIDADLLTFDQEVLDAVCTLQTPAARLMCELHGNERTLPLVRSGHFRCWDEMVVLGLLYPELCLDPPRADRLNRVSLTRFDRTATGVRYLDLLAGESSPGPGGRKPVVLKQYPTDPQLLREDLRTIAGAIIEKHGLEEWSAALLTNEFHRHLGIYSIVGVKMGIRAREILDAGLDDMTVISHSGLTPPLSCMIDGLQVSTGASLGRGTISVETDKAQPAAEFVKGNRRLHLRLKPGIAQRIQTDVKKTVQTHGGLTAGYWRAVRELSLRYWLELDRREIFDEILVDPSSE